MDTSPSRDISNLPKLLQTEGNRDQDDELLDGNLLPKFHDQGPSLSLGGTSIHLKLPSYDSPHQKFHRTISNDNLVDKQA